MHCAPPDAEFCSRDRRVLLSIARASIAHGLEWSRPLGKGDLLRTGLITLRGQESLLVQRASFVTLTKNGELRGCTGSLAASAPLALDVSANAYQTAFDDYRFGPLAAVELDVVRIEISVLSPQTEMAVGSEEQLRTELVPFEDGLVLDDGRHRATFLPKVWESLPDPRHFVAELKIKAGMPEGFWSDNIRVFRYHTETFAEPGR